MDDKATGRTDFLSPTPGKATKRAVISWVIGLCTVIAFVWGLYAYRFSHFPSSKESDWGEFGEYFGGTVGPLIGALTVAILIYTLLVQREDFQRMQSNSDQQLRSSQDQISLIQKQAYEQTLFSWINLHRANLNAIEWPVGLDEKCQGLHALDSLFKNSFDREAFRTSVTVVVEDFFQFHMNMATISEANSMYVLG